jgi:hypothetical protein
MKKQKLEYSFESPLVHLVEVSLNHDSTVTGTATVLTSPGSLKELLRFENKVDRAKNDEQYSTANNDQDDIIIKKALKHLSFAESSGIL